MAQCEICGVEIKGKIQYITIGASKLGACKACARYGTVVVEDKDVKIKIGGIPRDEAKRKLYEQMDHDIEAGMDIVDDYGRKIKEAREKTGLTQAEFAKRINEKQSLLRKIENGEIIPSEEVMRKIERALKPFLI